MTQLGQEVVQGTKRAVEHVGAASFVDDLITLHQRTLSYARGGRSLAIKALMILSPKDFLALSKSSDRKMRIDKTQGRTSPG